MRPIFHCKSKRIKFSDQRFKPAYTFIYIVYSVYIWRLLHNIYCELRWAAADGGINQYRINCLVGQNFLPKYPKHINNEMSKSFWPKFLAYQIKLVPPLSHSLWQSAANVAAILIASLWTTLDTEGAEEMLGFLWLKLPPKWVWQIHFITICSLAYVNWKMNKLVNK